MLVVDHRTVKRTPVVGIGAGGHAKVVIEALRRSARYDIRGLLDNATGRRAGSVAGVPILGGDDQLAQLRADGIENAFIGVGTPRDTLARIRIWGWLKQQGISVVSAIDPSAIVISAGEIGEGATVLARAVIQTDARLGKNVLINTGAIVEHDCEIHDHAHVASGAVLCGGVVVEEGAFIGSAACIQPGRRIGRMSVIGSGTVVIDDVPPATTMVGNPARPLAHTRYGRPA